MKKKIAILGSTGSIGQSTLDVIRKDKKSFEVVFLSFLIISKVDLPIEPVDPSIAIFFFIKELYYIELK